MRALAAVLIILGSTGLVIGIFAMTPYNELDPYSHVIGGGLQFALLLCGLGILLILVGLWLRQPKRALHLDKPF